MFFYIVHSKLTVYATGSMSPNQMKHIDIGFVQ